MGHWWLQRISALVLLGTIPFGIFVDARFLPLTIFAIAIHMNNGIESIMRDYVTNFRVRVPCVWMTKTTVWMTVLFFLSILYG